MLWNTYCLVRLSGISRGRAVPLVWCVLEHPSAAVAYEEYQGLLEKAAPLVPFACKVVLLADRGFADTELMHHLKCLGWHFRIRIKANFWIYRLGHGGCRCALSPWCQGNRGAGMVACSPQSALGLCISPWRGLWEGTSTGM